MTGGEVTTGAAVVFSATTGLAVLATGGGVIGFAVIGTGGSVTITGGSVTGGSVTGGSVTGDTVETGTGTAVGGIDIAER
jgi:hypothetical protein